MFMAWLSLQRLLDSLIWGSSKVPGGGTDLERGYGDVRPWRPPFHASPAARKGPISEAKESVHKTPFEKIWKFYPLQPQFSPNLSSQAPKYLEIFSSQAPKFENHLTSPRFPRQMSVRKPHTSEIRAAHPYLKKSWVPFPGSRSQGSKIDITVCLYNAAKQCSIATKICSGQCEHPRSSSY